VEHEAAVSARVSLSQSDVKSEEKEDIWYSIFGENDWKGVLILVVYVLAYGGIFAVGIFSFGFFSGGMRWLIVLFVASALAAASILLMKRGVEIFPMNEESRNKITAFRGELADLTDIAERGRSGMAYSQQIIRERVVDLILDMVRLSQGLGEDEIKRALDSGDASFVGDDALARFLLENRREAAGWDEKVKGHKGTSQKRGKIFIVEINEILNRMEAIY